jgi:hypothetical protein
VLFGLRTGGPVLGQVISQCTRRCRYSAGTPAHTFTLKGQVVLQKTYGDRVERLLCWLLRLRSRSKQAQLLIIDQHHSQHDCKALGSFSGRGAPGGDCQQRCGRFQQTNRPRKLHDASQSLHQVSVAQLLCCGLTCDAESMPGVQHTARLGAGRTGQQHDLW